MQAKITIIGTWGIYYIYNTLTGKQTKSSYRWIPVPIAVSIPWTLWPRRLKQTVSISSSDVIILLLRPINNMGSTAGILGALRSSPVTCPYTSIVVATVQTNTQTESFLPMQLWPCGSQIIAIPDSVIFVTKIKTRTRIIGRCFQRTRTRIIVIQKTKTK